MHGRNLAFRVLGLLSLCSPRSPFGEGASTLRAQPAKPLIETGLSKRLFCSPAAIFRTRNSATDSNAPSLLLRFPYRARFRSVRSRTPSPRAFTFGEIMVTKPVSCSLPGNPGQSSDRHSLSGFLPLPDQCTRSDSGREVYLGEMPDFPSLPRRRLVTNTPSGSTFQVRYILPGFTVPLNLLEPS